MKKIITTTIAAGLVASGAFAEVAVTMDLVSAYVYRGATFLDKPSFQPGVEAAGFGLAEEYGSIAFGAWGSYDLDGDNSSTFQETDWYVSYGLPSMVDGLDLSVGYCEYSYGSNSADKELSFGAGYDLSGVGLGVTLYQGIGSSLIGIGTQTYLEFTAGYGYDFTEELSGSIDASLGWLDEGNAGDESGFNDYSVSASLGYALSELWSVSGFVSYIGQIDDAVLTDDEYDVSFVGGIGVSCEM
ncbi:hypothetical protein [Pontiella sp.]|uniref:hypothetical protein n=1 Tax=Pontiella sp. TaxID=2837462 RepID=UPI003564A10A